MFININRYKRASLKPEQKEFLHVLVPFGRMVQEQVRTKCRLANINTKLGICASLIIADSIIKSEWGQHKLAKKYNNLSLLIADDLWYGKVRDQDGIKYRTYECWFDYAADLSDLYVFSGDYLSLLVSKNLDDQIDSVVELNEQIKDYRSKIEELIEDLGLWEFDYPVQS